jgi:hypothetical protein
MLCACLLLCTQTLECNVSGTSITASFDTAAGVLSLSGLDATANYRRALASVRYRNPGALVPLPGRTPVINVLTFAPGVRMLLVVVRDGAGGTATDNSTVECIATPRVVVPGRDPSAPAPPDCNGNGTLTLDPDTVRAARVCARGCCARVARCADVRALAPHARSQGEASCECNLGYEGDQCEIPPCLGHGVFNAAKAQAGLQACTCFAVRLHRPICFACLGSHPCTRMPAARAFHAQPWTGSNCSVACGGFGVPGLGGTCRCHTGHGGVDCSLTCPGCGPHGLCTTNSPLVNGVYLDSAVAVCRPCEAGWCVPGLAVLLKSMPSPSHTLWLACARRAGVNCTLPCPCYRGSGPAGISGSTCAVSADERSVRCAFKH